MRRTSEWRLFKKTNLRLMYSEPISEAERIEEGKRMFQIFAARMFEARVLQAYRERVAKQREEQLLLELDAEDEFKRQREEKKASQSQKKKDKKKCVHFSRQAPLMLMCQAAEAEARGGTPCPRSCCGCRSRGY